MSHPPTSAPGRAGAATTTKRRQLFEFEDLPWVPALLRDGITDWLQQCVVLRYDAYTAAAPLIADLVARLDGPPEIVDLCSGAGGPWPGLKGAVEALAGPTSLVLTDLFPNAAALTRVATDIGDGRTTARLDPVDARSVPEGLTGVRTLFTAVHHLRPQQVRDLLEDAFDRRVPIGAFDFCGREQVAETLRMGVKPIWVTMRDVRPRTAARLALTYLLPVLPVMILWDAVVSNLRAYAPEDLDELVADLQAPDWCWTSGRIASPMAPITYITGSPRP